MATTQTTKDLPNIQKLAAMLSAMAPIREPAASAATPEDPASSLSEATSGNAAVDRCLAAYAKAHRETLATRTHEAYAREAARNAYKRSMPPLVGSENVGDFIACIARGVIENVFCGTEATQFLYAAQVANSVKNTTTAAAPKRPRGRPAAAKSSLTESREEVNSPVNTQPESYK